ncbi:MAG: cellulase family glycosylhydrolase [Spirochaetales bacterium]|nr:cellulase family glycosylhydrolase [Spirochaetales bacterium]
MKKGIIRTLFTMVMFIFGATCLQAEVGFYIKNGRLYDANDNEFVMFGVSHAHTWYTNRTSAIADIARVGANALRVVLSAGKHDEGWIKNGPSDVQNIIDLCKANKLVAMLECHDTTGYGEKQGAVSMSLAVDYWKELKSVLTGQEAYVLINIANEPYGNVNAINWIDDTINAIKEMRAAGFEHTLVVDAPSWGQDWERIMLDNAPKVYDADITGNLILSVHMYGVYEKDATIKNYISAIRDQNLPLIIGEFGWDHSDGNPDEYAIMYRAVEYNIGYFGWSWCGNGGGVEYLDMVNNWDVNQLTNWGEIIVNGPNGLKSRSGTCTVFTGGDSVTNPPLPDPTPTPELYGSCAGLPSWSANAIYNQTGTKVVHNGFVYSNRWYSADQNPEDFSADNQVWEWLGMCSDVVVTDPPPTPTPFEPQCSRLGDVNNDDIVNIVDALLIAQAYVGVSGPLITVECGDVNCDSTQNIVDALLVAQKYVGIIDEFPCVIF